MGRRAICWTERAGAVKERHAQPEDDGKLHSPPASASHQSQLASTITTRRQSHRLYAGSEYEVPDETHSQQRSEVVVGGERNWAEDLWMSDEVGRPSCCLVAVIRNSISCIPGQRRPSSDPVRSDIRVSRQGSARGRPSHPR